MHHCAKIKGKQEAVRDETSCSIKNYIESSLQKTKIVIKYMKAW